MGQSPPAESMSSAPPRGDEVTPIAKYMVQQMVTNARSIHAHRMLEWNQAARRNCFEEYTHLPLWQQLLGGREVLESCQNGAMAAKMLALAEWTRLVRENGPWDHKPYIRTQFKPANPQGREQNYHHHKGWLYFYDIWSNIHYGYVGRACGFSSSELLDGAGLEQIGSDIVHLRMPRASPGVQGLRRFDDSSDRLSVTIGIRLYPHSPTVESLLGALQNTPGLSRKPLKQ